MDTADIVLGPDIQFATQAAQFEPITGNYPTEDLSPPPPPSGPTPPPTPPMPPQSSGAPIERYEYDSNTYSPAPLVDPSDCDSSAVYGGEGYGVRARQIPDNWLWGCNGSAYRTGPGNCDDWNVGCRWETSVDGMMLFRKDANLVALRGATDLDSNGGFLGDPIVYDQFDYAPGGRVSFIGRYPKWAGYEVQAQYEGIEEWNSTIVYPKISPYPPAGPANSTEQSSLFYRSSLQSAELNILRRCDDANRWFGGVRYIRFGDEINYSINQEVMPPLPANPPVTVSESDQRMLNDLDNNLIGFQIGGRHDLWQPMRRFTLEGFFNAGVYYNQIKRTDRMSVRTTEFVGADSSMADDFGVTNVSTVTTSVNSEPTNIAFVGEASLTGVCRLNKCWACRAGYQVLWLDGVSLAQDAFLDTGVDSRTLLFHGWHAGVECRR